jgi:cephalosporin hydroxylase
MTLGQSAVGLHGANLDDWETDQLLCWLERTQPAPRLVAEIGCDRGGSLWLWRQLGADVVAVTLHTRPDGSWNDHGATVVVGDSTDGLVRQQLAGVLDGRQPDWVFVDGGHDYATAVADIGWALRLAPDGLVLVHDVNRRVHHPQIETWMAWAEYATERPSLVISRRGDASPGVGILYPKGT